MTSRTVVGTVVLPGGTVSQAAVTIELVAATTGTAIGWVASADLGVGGRRVLQCDNAGAWTVDLRPNSLISPAGTVYRVTYSQKSGQWATTFTISVPDSTGPHRVEDLLVDPPATLPTAALTAHIDDPIGHASAIPTGGVAGQVLTKTSATDYADAWRTPTLLGPHFVVVSAEESERYESWPWLMQMRSQGRLSITQHTNSSVVNATATSILSLIDNYLGPIQPSFCILEFGYHDLTTQTVPQFAAAMQTLVEYVAAKGIVPVLTTVLPRAAADGLNTTTYKARAAAASMWLKNYAALAGYPLIDFHGPLTDPATGALRAEYATSFYWSTAGYRAAADIALASLEPYLRPWRTVEATYEGDPNNLVANAFTLPDSNADGVPNGWGTASDGAGTTFSIVNDARFKGGKAIQIAASAPATSRQIYTANLNASGTAISAGDVCAVTFSYTVESSSGLNTQPETAGFGCWVQMPSQWQFFAYHQIPYDRPTPVRYSGATWEPSDINRFSGLVYFPINPTPSVGWYDRGLVALMWRMQGIGAGALTVRIGDIGFYNLTKMGALHNGQAVGSWNWVNSYAPSNYWPLGS